MGWSIGYDENWNRDVGYGVPAFCDHPGCDTEIDRGLAYVCCEQQPYGGENGCGLYFCEKHRSWLGRCERCAKASTVVCSECDEEMEEDREDALVCPCCERTQERPDFPSDWKPFDAKPEHPRWMRHVLTDASWAEWREKHPKNVAAYEAALTAADQPASPLAKASLKNPSVALGESSSGDELK